MKFGIVKSENFDPVQDIDLQQTIVTIDTRLTNVSMWTWDPAEWSGILKALRSVSLYHPLWRPDRNLGLRSWVTAEDGMESNSIPEPQFDVPLLPVELWVPENDTVARSYCPVFCPNCRTSFNFVGALIHHCRDRLCPECRVAIYLNTMMMIVPQVSMYSVRSGMGTNAITAAAAVVGGGPRKPGWQQKNYPLRLRPLK